MLKPRYTSINRLMSPKHLQRYVQQFAGRHRIRSKYGIDLMAAMVLALKKKWLRYRDLVE